MSQLAPSAISFDQFTAINADGRYELVDGRLETLVAPRPRHGLTGGRLFAILDEHLTRSEAGGYCGVELDIPTLPHHGRRPDIVYYDPEAAALGINLEQDRVTGLPTLVIEVVSPDDEGRDLITKRREYAQAGIPHYWIADPGRRSLVMLVLRDGIYQSAGSFSDGEVASSDLLPGLSIPLSRIFL